MTNNYQSNNYQNVKINALACFLSLALIGGLSACQPTSDDNKKSDSVDASLVTNIQDDSQLNKDAQQNKPAITPSSQAQDAINNFEAEFVAKMLDLQNIQEDEFERSTTATTPSSLTHAASSIAQNSAQSTQNNALNSDSNLSESDNNNDSTSQTVATQGNLEQSDISSTQAESLEDVSDISLVDLPLATTPIQPTQELSALEVSSRYKVAMQSLYLPEEVPLSSEAANTLINIATLVPKVFEEKELAERLVLKMPALARLLKQYQVWEQIETKQNAELMALKQAQVEAQEAQAQKFDELVAEFDQRIKAYDEQIKKYEKKLAEFEQ